MQTEGEPRTFFLMLSWNPPFCNMEQVKKKTRGSEGASSVLEGI